jgi:very-short-patch-repair endonuclease
LRPALSPGAIDSGIPADATTGVYNCIGIFLNVEHRFAGGALQELERLSGWSDDDLEGTALAAIFVARSPGDEPVPTLHPLPLGEDQLDAVRDGLMRPLTVVTGPPGTGKSQLVASFMFSAALAGKSVLFASRNHKALDAVEDRLHELSEDRVLLARVNSRDGSADFSFAKAIDALLSRPDVPGARSKLEEKTAILVALDRERWEAAEDSRAVEKQGETVGHIVEQVEAVKRALGEKAADWLSDNRQEIDRRKISSVLASTTGVMHRLPIVGRWLMAVSAWRLSRRLKSCGIDWMAVGHPMLGGAPADGHKDFLQHTSELLDLLDQLEDAELELKRRIEAFRSRNADLIGISTSIEKGVASLIDLLADVLESCTPDERNALATIKGEIAINRAAGEQGISANLGIWTAHRDLILDHFPLWAVTSLAVSSRIPLIPALFDYVVIDEASQCDFASSIPLLSRARNAVIVGDPQQLSHVSQLSPAWEHEAISAAGLFRPGIGRFLYSINSLFQIAASAAPASHITLRDHYRCHPDIADYVSEAFYGRQLHVLTPETEIRPPRGMKPGIHWTHVEGTLLKAPTGCKSKAEAEVIATHLRELLVQQQYEGTVGVVTPFSHQSVELMRHIERVVPYEAIKRVQLIADTVHKFQGDARDVMLFSLCIGPDMPRGARHFVSDNRRLFNVAISRCRAICHVFGNLHYARTCGIDHIARLADRIGREPGRRRTRSEEVFESPWERRLYEALTARGLEPVPQFPLAGRRLDLALFNGPINLDVEVDGDRWHRDQEGLRRSSDLWRDHQIRGLGWKIRRFWVYELREDMEACVARAISDLDE